MTQPAHISILLIPGFMLSAFALFTDALRLANWRSGELLFSWDTVSPTNQAVIASDGTTLQPTAFIETDKLPIGVFVAAGFSPEQGLTPDVLKWLKTADRQRALLGGWDTGPIVLADAGLMEGQDMSVHWQALPAIQDTYQSINLHDDRLSTSKRRFTGPGGISTFDLGVELIRFLAGPSVADMVVQSANRHIRPVGDVEHSDDRSPGGRLNSIVSLMEQNLSDPIPVPELAQRVGLSQRSMNRFFVERFRKPPAQYYLGLRLHHAADLLRQTQLNMVEVSDLSGFTSASRFSQAFRKYFDKSPSEVRNLASWMHVAGAKSETRKLLKTSDDI